MDDYIPLSVPCIKGNELAYVTKALQSEWVADGSYINLFEEAMSAYIGTAEAVACQSGTAGLHLALKVLDVGENQEVIAPTLTFVAAVNPIRYVGAEPIFMDCDVSLCMDMKKLEDFCINECEIIDSKLINRKTKKHIAAVIVVHVFGNLADMEHLLNIARKFNLKVIEDATEALGSYYISNSLAGKFAGTLGDIGVFSFNGNKIITTGGGGMVVSKNKQLLTRMKHLSTQAKANPVYFFHDEVGYNYRMTNIQAAIGVAQLEQLEQFIEKKKENYDLYRSLGIELHLFSKDIRPNYWFYSHVTSKRDELISYLSENNVQSRPVWHLIHELPFYSDNQKYKVEKARFYHDRIVNIPCSSNLSSKNVYHVAKLILDLKGK